MQRYRQKRRQRETDKDNRNRERLNLWERKVHIHTIKESERGDKDIIRQK